MSMSAAGMKAAMLAELGAAGVTVVDDAAVGALAKAVVDYVKANAEVVVPIKTGTGGLQTSTAAGSPTNPPLVSVELSGGVK